MAFIKIGDGSAGFNPAFVLSFATEKDFLSATSSEYYQHLDEKTRKATLKEVYRIAKKQADEHPGTS